MNREQIIEMAVNVGLAEWHDSIQNYGFSFATPAKLEKFAALVAAAEREECEKVCSQDLAEEIWTDDGDYDYGMLHGIGECAKAIRARGQQ